MVTFLEYALTRDFQSRLETTMSKHRSTKPTKSLTPIYPPVMVKCVVYALVDIDNPFLDALGQARMSTVLNPDFDTSAPGRGIIPLEVRIPIRFLPADVSAASVVLVTSVL